MGLKKCKTCDQTFSSSRRLWDHVNVSHRNAPVQVRCNLCEYSSVSKNCLYTHKRRVHREKIECIICHKKVKNLSSHRKKVHSNLNAETANDNAAEVLSSLMAVDPFEETETDDNSKILTRVYKIAVDISDIY